MSDAPELAPCPLCGDLMEWWGDDMIRHREAGKCPLGMMGFTTTQITAWNRRAPRVATAEMVEKVADAPAVWSALQDYVKAAKYGGGAELRQAIVRAALRALGYEVRE